MSSLGHSGAESIRPPRSALISKNRNCNASSAMVVGIRRLPRSASDEQKIAGVELTQCHVPNLDRIVGVDRNHDARANLGHVRLERAEVGKHRLVELKDVLHTIGVLEVGDCVLAEASSENEC